ncbi:MAG: efflux transporter outer membrane subunit [Gammaproteobacteria bacterium]
MNKHSISKYLRVLLTILVSVALAACVVGPTYQKPAAPTVRSYTSAPLSTSIPAVVSASGPAASAQVLQIGAKVNAEWWKEFGSSKLDALVAQALQHNPDLEAALATLHEAQFNLKAANGIFYPQVSLGLGAERSRISGASSGGQTGPQLYNLYTGQVSVSYYPDVFGLSRLVSSNEQAQVDIARDQLQAARLTLEGNVVNTALNLAAVEEEVAVTRQTISDQREILRLTTTLYQLGADSQIDVLTQESQLASTEARLPVLEQSRDALRHLLATYLGKFPSEAGGLTTPALSGMRLPGTLPVSLPSTLVRERPDILAAEAQLRAANAQVGEAVARMYPSLELTGDFGDQSNNGGQLFNPASRIWDLAASIVLPLFEGGALEAQKHATESAYQAVFANYRSTVLDAFLNVADTLRALQHDSTVLDAQARALQAAQQGFELVRVQYQSGAVNYLNVLVSETLYENARIAFVQAEAQRYADTTALYIALGGGEWAGDGNDNHASAKSDSTVAPHTDSNTQN